MKNRRRFVITLTWILLLLQLIAIAVSGAGSGLRPAPSSIFVSILLAAGIGMVDFFTVIYLLAAVRRSERAYATQVTTRLESSLEGYRVQVEREERLIQQIGTEIETELRKAQAALERGGLMEADHHLRTSLSLASQVKTIPCDNIYVSAVLESKLRQCKEAGIGLNAQVSLPRELSIQSVEVATLFFNLIDNALHECRALRESGVGADSIGIGVRGLLLAGQLFIEVDNPCRPGVDSELQAAKRRADTSDLHGWGTQIVAEIARNHNGISTFAERDGRFVAQVMLPLSQEQAL